VLIYVNHGYIDDFTGKGAFERELVTALRERVAAEPGTALEVFIAGRAEARSQKSDLPSDTLSVVLDKRRPIGYVAHQIRLVWALLPALVRHWRDDVTIYSRYSVSSIAPVALATLFGRRLVMRTGPALKNLEIYQKHPGPLSLLAIRLSFWWNCRKASAIIVVTRQIQRYVEGVHPFTRGKTRVIPNGVNLDHFPLCLRDRTRWGLNEHGLVLGFVGTLYIDHGLDVVIRALANIQAETGSTPQLLVVGDGPCRAEWAALAESSGVGNRVVFAGQRPHHEIASALAACDVLLAPFTRRTFEVTGSSAMKLFEYLACDKPVLASRAEDHQFLAESGVGWLVEPEDVDAWAAAIRARMHEPTAGLGGRGRQLAERSYSFRTIAERVWSTCFGPTTSPVATRLVEAHD
jgi:glycosyltransferase involved in cell wall biosynthesis